MSHDDPFLMYVDRLGTGGFGHAGAIRTLLMISGDQFVGFGMVWAALAMYAVEGDITRRWYPIQEVL